MNEETKKAMDALAGAGAVDGGNAKGGEATDWKAKYEEAQKALASAKVEQGRVKKLDEELKALQRQLEDERSARRTQTVIDGLPEEVRGDVPEDYLKAQAEIARRTADQALASRDAEMEALKARLAERDQRESAASQQRFTERLEREFPGFLSGAVSEGGDKHAAWVDYQRYNAASIAEAARTFDFDALAWHIRAFYTTALGIDPPSGGMGIATPDPSGIGGGVPVVTKPGKVYTEQELSSLYDEVEKARDRGDYAEVKRIGAEIDRAMREGRVKQ